MSKQYNNGGMVLELKAVYGDYALFLRVNRSDYNYIVAWLPKFDGNNVSWGQGHYDYNKEDAIELLCEKAHCKMSDLI